MGKWKAILPIVCALIIAGVGSLSLYRWLKYRSNPVEMIAPAMNTSDVVVAVVDIPWGTKLQPKHVKKVSYPAGNLPEGAFNDPKGLDGRVVILPLKLNEPILETKLAPVDVKVGGVSAILKPGKRAIAVKGDKVIGLSGLIRPGNLVDVFVTIQNPQNKKETAKLVLEKVPVLATGSQIEEGKDGESPVDVYTLEVSPEEGERLALAATRGRLQFALRNVMDTETVLTRGATIGRTLASLSPKRQPVKPKSRPKITPALFTLEVIKDGKLEQQKLKY